MFLMRVSKRKHPFQEISNGRTHWTDPEKTWVSNISIAPYWTGSVGIRSHSIFHGSILRPRRRWDNYWKVPRRHLSVAKSPPFEPPVVGWGMNRPSISMAYLVATQIFFLHVRPEPWGNDPIWRSYFSDGLVQPPTRWLNKFAEDFPFWGIFFFRWVGSTTN